MHFFAKSIALVFLVLLISFTLMVRVTCVPLPKVDAEKELMPKIPQWHCLRYFRHDVIMMRRCRHLRVPTSPRLSDVKK